MIKIIVEQIQVNMQFINIIITLFLIISAIGITGCALTETNQKNDEITSYSSNISSPKSTDIFIVANPVNLSTLMGITKFRSCFGHEFGYTSAFEGKEAKSSLKHYFVPDFKYENTNNAVPVYAPFDGVIIYTEEGTQQFMIEQRPFNGWVFDFAHVFIKEGLKTGSEVKAGELVGYVDLITAHAFDISLQTKSKSGYGKDYDWFNNYESIFNHMSDEVYAQYVAAGINKENIIILKAFRDANPCPCDDSQPPYPNSPYCPFIPIPYDDQGNGVELKK